jgi:hypothetical protein
MYKSSARVEPQEYVQIGKEVHFSHVATNNLFPIELATPGCELMNEELSSF